MSRIAHQRIKQRGRWTCVRLLRRPDSYSATLCQEGEPPLQQDEEPIGESNEEVDMHHRPEEPSGKTRELRKAQVGDRICAPCNGEVTLVPIPERPRLAACSNPALTT